MSNQSPENDPLVMDHEADGIRELDNLLPRWWVWLFHLTVMFSLIYMVYYHVLGKGDSQRTAYEKENAVGEEIKLAALAKFESSLDKIEPAQDPVTLQKGAAVFTTLCAPCHRADGGGLVGPNLTDDYWIHGSTFQDNLKTVINGVPEKGMLSWRSMLKPDEIKAVCSFIYSLRGTKPPNPKAPENQAPVQQGPSEFE